MASKIERISLDLESHAMACHIPKNPGNRAVWLKGSSNFILVCPSSSELDDSKCPQYLRIPANAMSAPRLPLTGVGKDDAPVKRRLYVPCPVVSPPTADPRAGPVHVLAAANTWLQVWVGLWSSGWAQDMTRRYASQTETYLSQTNALAAQSSKSMFHVKHH